MSVSGSDGPNGDRGLTPVEKRQEAERALGVPFAAMAEALRANAEALSRIDRNQRKIAESIERGDKASSIITSTRALNETFRGLGEIQRGLLDAVVKDRGRGRGLPFAFAAVAILAALLGFLLYERWTAGDTVPREVYEQERARGRDLGDRVAELKSMASDSGGRVEGLKAELEDSDRKLRGARRDSEELATANRKLTQELASKDSRLENYLAVKAAADRVGAVEVRNARLERENRDLRAKLERVEREREQLLVMMGDKKRDERGPDPAAIKQAFEQEGVIPKAAPPPKAAPAGLTSAGRRRLRRQLNNLLQQASGEETYELLSFAGLRDGTVLTDVKVGHYRNAGLLNSLHCKELEVVLDPRRDTAELRFKSGYFSLTRHPAKRVPLDEKGHFVFLKGLGVKAWMERAVLPVSLGDAGRLTWKTATR